MKKTIRKTQLNLLLLISLLIIFSFTKDEQENKQSIESANPIVNFFTHANSLPLQIDSSYFDQISDNDLKVLKTKQVKELTSVLNRHEAFDQMNWELKSFYELDSIKDAGTYEAYKENIDLAMTMYSDAYAYDKIQFDKETIGLIWLLSSSTMDACPFASGTIYFLSILHKGKITDCILIAESITAGDPPSGMSRYIYSKINKDMNIHFASREIIEEEDWDTGEMIIEENVNIYNAYVSKGKIKFTD
jgi:hypothetical protein